MCRFSGFFVNDYILNIAGDSSNEVRVLAVFVKEWLSFACDTSAENVGNFWSLIYPMSITALLSILTRGSLEAL